MLLDFHFPTYHFLFSYLTSWLCDPTDSEESEGHI